MKTSITNLLSIACILIYFTSCKKKKVKTDIDYLKKGKEIALSTKALLGENLIKAIQKKGTDKALEFCNINAIPLTDSIANTTNTSIKRVSDKNRNPNNYANKNELVYIRLTKDKLKNGKKATPKIQEVNNKMVGYYPIISNPLCLQCHGKKPDIDKKTTDMIAEKYPLDKATGYSANELRGIWVITIDK